MSEDLRHAPGTSAASPRTAVSRVRDALVRALEWTLIGGFAILVLDVLWGVFSRYVLGAQSRWTEELAIYLLVWVSLLGATVTYAENGHLGVDYFVGKLDPAARKAAAIAVEIIVFFFSAFVLVWGGWVLISKTLESGQMSPALDIPMGYIYLAAPLSGVFFLLFSFENLVAVVTGRSEGKEEAILDA